MLLVWGAYINFGGAYTWRGLFFFKNFIFLNLLPEFPYKCSIFTPFLRITQKETTCNNLSNSHTELGSSVVCLGCLLIK